MYRVIVISLVLMLIYYLIRKAVLKQKETGGWLSPEKGRDRGNQMVQDPCLSSVCTACERSTGRHWRADVLFLQRRVREGLSETTLELTAGVVRVGDHFVPVKEQNHLAFGRIKVK